MYKDLVAMLMRSKVLVSEPTTARHLQFMLLNSKTWKKECNRQFNTVKGTLTSKARQYVWPHLGLYIGHKDEDKVRRLARDWAEPKRKKSRVVKDIKQGESFWVKTILYPFFFY